MAVDADEAGLSERRVDGDVRGERARDGAFLEASGDLISTGPTGTNVRDLVIAWKGQ